MAKVMHLNKSKQNRADIIQEVLKAHNKGEVSECIIIYTKGDTTFANYFFEDDVKLIGMLEATKMQIMLGE